MKVGDIVKYRYPGCCGFPPAVILYINIEGGTLKTMNTRGEVDWFVTSYCEVISEGR